MDGTCECGCGGVTAIAAVTDRSKGWERGKPLRFLLGHNARVQRRGPRRELSPADYSVEARGFESPCWIWRGKPTGSQGYCRVKIRGRYQAAHRAYYEEFVGPIPDGHDIHHRCEQHACVRPEHLEAQASREHRSQHVVRKLTDDDVRAIRADPRPLREIAAQYGISYRYASCVRSGWYRRSVTA